MNIIFGDVVNQISEKYIILELDTIHIESLDKKIKSYCLVQHVPLGEFAKIETNKKIHSDLLKTYRNRDWESCNKCIELLTGSWNGELDTFYLEMKARISRLQSLSLPSGWDGSIAKSN